MRITEAPLVLVDLQTEEGITGRAHLFCYLESAGRAAIALTRDVSAVLAGTAAYNSNGLGLIEPQAAADEALELASRGLPRHQDAARPPVRTRRPGRRPGTVPSA
jgi:mandelate racemase/muconate lactonizing enzyme-like protein